MHTKLLRNTFSDRNMCKSQRQQRGGTLGEGLRTSKKTLDELIYELKTKGESSSDQQKGKGSRREHATPAKAGGRESTRCRRHK